MGTTTSKTNSDLSLSTTDTHTWRLALKNRVIIHSGWQEICRCSHNDWIQGISGFFGFVQHKFLCHSELHIVCAPGFCSESLSLQLHPHSHRSLSTKSKKLHEHFQYNHIPAMISSLQNYSIHGIVNGGSNEEDTIMLLIYSAVLEKTKFIIVDLKLNRFVCALGENYYGLIDTKKVYAAWSMDRTQVLIRMPILGGTPVLDFYKIVKKEAKLYRRIVSIDSHAQFQFCPNYWSSRLVLYSDSTPAQMTLINYNISTLTASSSNKTQAQTIPLHQSLVGSNLSLINIHSWSTYTNQSIVFEDGFRLLSVQYTPDSVYLILIFVDNLCHCGSTYPESYLEIYHSNSLQRLYRIDTQLMSRTCPWHLCRNYFTPMFSRSSSRMAFCTTKNHNGRELQVSIIALPNDFNLKSICRRLIIDYLNQFNGNLNDITHRLPYRLNQYVQYRPEYQ